MSGGSREYRLDDEVRFLKGVGPRNAEKLAKIGVRTLYDLLYLIPRRYEDRTNVRPIRSLRSGETVTVRGRIIDAKKETKGGRLTLIKGAISDGDSAIRLVWFNQKWVYDALTRSMGREMVAYGTVKEGMWGLQMESPEWEILDGEGGEELFASVVPVYPLTEGISQKVLRRIARTAVSVMPALPDPLPEEIRKQFGLSHIAEAIRAVHLPESLAEAEEARRRLVFEEFLILQLALALRRAEVVAASGISFDATDVNLAELEEILPWPLTNAQKRVIGEIYRDMRSPHPMNRLLQGDVGSGKTVVAAAAMLAAIRSGYQAALMVPTEILAEQHYINLTRLLEPLGLDIELLVGRLTKREKDRARERTRSGEAHIAVGTHALIQEGVEFKKLGLVVVDEQHRFGVLQRGRLREKGYGNPDVLVMTATPIPRTLTLTLYGDLDLSVLDEMPPGRKPIKTYWKSRTEREAVYDGVRKLLDAGAQVYVVCPLIEESEKMQAQAATELYEDLSERWLGGYRVGLLHGQMKTAEKAEVMDAFRRGELQVLVSTTVIEVGVDVPNATVMVIEDANRFGLAQLHQLRGRVGRGERQSYCVLIAEATTTDAEERLRALVKTTNGFEIAEADLRIRGPGELFGTKQAGFVDFRVADLLRDGAMLEQAKEAAETILKQNPKLEGPQFDLLRTVIAERSRKLMQTDVS